MGHPLSFPMSVFVRSLGTLAHALLREGQSLQVFARTSQTLFLSTGGEVVWVSRGSMGHRRALLVERLPDWPEGLVLRVIGKSLVDGSGEPLFFGHAALWSPPPLPCPPADLPLRASTLALTYAQPLEPVREMLGAQRLARISKAIRARDGLGLLEVAGDLVGWGPGLTPLGDDFLGGVLFALNAAQEPWVDEERPRLMAWAQDRTSKLSLTLLSDLSQGYGPEPLHHLALALFTRSLEEAKPKVQELLSLGHTTGVALLFGALLAWSALD